MELTPEQVENFWSKVHKTETCWLWTGTTSRTGYGIVRINGKAVKTHHVGVALAGIEVPKGLCRLHKCNTPPCVRYHPDHIYLGTRKQNTEDLWATGYKVKLTEDQVRDIIRQYDGQSIFIAETARKYGVTYNTIWCIVHKITWKHLWK